VAFLWALSTVIGLFVCYLHAIELAQVMITLFTTCFFDCRYTKPRVRSVRS
jgi:hypothetical protein